MLWFLVPRLCVHPYTSVQDAVRSTCSYPNIAATGHDQWLWPFNTKVDPSTCRRRKHSCCFSVIAVGAPTSCFRTITRLLRNVAARFCKLVKSVFVLLTRLCCAFLSLCLLCSGCMLVVGALWNCLTNRKARWHILQGLSANWDLRVSNNVQGGFLAMASRRESLRGEKCGSTDPVPFMVDRRGYLCFKGNDG